MTRRDYIAAAAAFRAELEMRAELEPTRAAAGEYHAKTEGIRRGVELMADVFAADNPRFDRGRFFAAAAPRSAADKRSEQLDGYYHEQLRQERSFMK